MHKTLEAFAKRFGFDKTLQWLLTTAASRFLPVSEQVNLFW